jgi:hypothetical protein
MFLGLPDPDLDLLVLGTDMDLAPNPSIIKQGKPSSYCFVSSLLLFIFENDVNLALKINKQKT